MPINSIFQKLRNVNTFGEKISKKSFEQQSTYVDSEGRELTKEQAEYFKDSKVRRKNGKAFVCDMGKHNRKNGRRGYRYGA